MPDRFSLQAEVPGGPDAARQARRFIRQSLEGRVRPEVLEDIVLLVTELVANGVRHGGAGPGSHVRVSVVGGPGVRVEVVDPGVSRTAGRAVAPRRPDLRVGGGLGLHLVDRRASRWGVRSGSPTAVWFELDG